LYESKSTSVSTPRPPVTTPPVIWRVALAILIAPGCHGIFEANIGVRLSSDAYVLASAKQGPESSALAKEGGRNGLAPAT
jgi:hypothetical protein